MTRSEIFNPLYSPGSLPDSDPLTILQSGGLVLMPTANLWQMVADVRNRSAIRRLLTVCPPTPINWPELIFCDHHTLLEWFPRLHPKLDNLLLYHEQSVCVHTPTTGRIPTRLVDERGEVRVRLAGETLTSQLCREQGYPLVGMLGTPDPQSPLPTRFGRIRSDVVRAANFTVLRRQKEDLAPEPLMRVRMEGDELRFL